MKTNLRVWLIAKLRNISRMWPEKNVVVNAAKERVHIGFYKNGNPEYKTVFKCNACKELFDRSEIQVDHIIPIVAIDGFTNWDDYLNKLFCDASGMQCLCKGCHHMKTDLENQERKLAREKNKKKSK